MEKLSGEAGDALSRSICLPSNGGPSVSRLCLLYRRDAKFCSEVLFGLYTEAVNEQKKNQGSENIVGKKGIKSSNNY